MTRHVHLTPLGGIAGDMFAAAMLDALPALRDPVLREVRAVLPANHPAPVLKVIDARGLTASRFDVPPFKDKAPIHYPDMAGMIEQSAASSETRRIGGTLLRLLAEAEATVHGCTVEQVHFHEIADWDTLADLSAAAAVLGALADASWSLDPLPLGGGTVKTRHGVMPVPAPATSVLLQGLPVHDDGLTGERVTPTGACIARYIATQVGLTPRPAGMLAATGRGSGTRELPDRPNVLVAQVLERSGLSHGTVTVLEFDIDDMTAEETAAGCDALRATGGVLDLTCHAVSGKKGRIATRIRLLAEPWRAETIAAHCFRLTSTIGLRLHEERRLLLPRSALDSGGIRVKQVQRPDGKATSKAESDDLLGLDSLAERRRLARKAEDQA